jgi:hypothetical protein
LWTASPPSNFQLILFPLENFVITVPRTHRVPPGCLGSARFKMRSSPRLVTTGLLEVTIRSVIILMVFVGLVLFVGIILLLDRESGPDGQIADRLRRHERPGPLAEEAERWLRGELPR